MIKRLLLVPPFPCAPSFYNDISKITRLARDLANAALKMHESQARASQPARAVNPVPPDHLIRQIVLFLLFACR